MNRMRELRGKKSQIQIANELGISQRTYSNYESEQRQPAPDMLIKIANYFGVTVDYLLGRDLEISKMQIAINHPAVEVFKEYGISLEDFNKLSKSQMDLIAKMMIEIKNSRK